MVGFVMFPAALYEWLEKRGRENILLIIMVPVIILFCFRTILRNREWSDIERFYLNELKYTTSSVRIYNNLGMYYADQKNLEKTIFYYTKAIQTEDRYPQPHHNLANFYFDQGQYDKAIAELHLALKIDPNFVYSLSALSNIYNITNQTDKAQKVYQLLLNVQNGSTNTSEEIDLIMQ
jgi:tetratricopeptide (TPR) repeat protein